MSKIEVISDHIDVEKNRLTVSIGIPLDFLREAVKNPDKIKDSLVIGLSEALDTWLVQSNMGK